MVRDIANIIRDLEDKKNNDIIRKKDLLKKMFYEDPDILEILGKPERKPLNKYVDKDSPTEEELKERQGIIEYNRRIEKPQIISFLKLNGIQKEVLNFLMFDIDDTEVFDYNRKIKEQVLIVMCLVHEDDTDTEYGIDRHDLLSYLVKDLLDGSNAFGTQITCVSDYRDIIDFKYYCRTLKFRMLAPTNVGVAGNNRYDRFKI